MKQQVIQVNLTKGINLSLMGYFSLAMMSICAKFLFNLPVSTLIFAQFFIAFLFTLPKVIYQGMEGIKTSKPGLMILRALTGMFSMAAMFFAIRDIPLIDAVLLQNTVPLFVPLVLFLGLRKKITWKIWLGLAIGFTGIMFIIKPNTSIFHPAAFIGLSAGMLSAISVVSISVLKTTESANKITFYFLLIGSILSAPFMVLHWAPIHLHQLTLLLGLGLFLYFGQLLVTQAFAHGDSHILSPLSYSTVVFTGLLSSFIWNHVPDFWSLFGMLMVCAGGVLVIVLAD
jgi:drug/metabolite transporter (DMT)-like permease